MAECVSVSWERRENVEECEPVERWNVGECEVDVCIQARPAVVDVGMVVVLAVMVVGDGSLNCCGCGRGLG